MPTARIILSLQCGRQTRQNLTQIGQSDFCREAHARPNNERNIKVMKNRSNMLALILAVLVCLGLWHDWIELVIGVELDGGNGLLEWLLSASTIACVTTGSALARRHWPLCQEQRI